MRVSRPETTSFIPSLCECEPNSVFTWNTVPSYLSLISHELDPFLEASSDEVSLGSSLQEGGQCTHIHCSGAWASETVGELLFMDTCQQVGFFMWQVHTRGSKARRGSPALHLMGPPGPQSCITFTAVHTYSQDPAQPIPTPSYIFQSRVSAQGHRSVTGMAFLLGT